MRGGKRIGAGRKAVDGKKVTIALRIAPKVKEKLQEYVTENDTTISAVVEDIIKTFVMGQNRSKNG